MQLFESLKAAAAERQKAVEAATAKATAMLKPALQQFMEANPELRAVRWSQYTPYFNDGEACEFGVNDVEFLTHADEVEDDEDAEWHYTYERECGASAATIKGLKELEAYLQSAEDECEAIFGDHVRVVVTKDGVEVEEYDHD